MPIGENQEARFKMKRAMAGLPGVKLEMQQETNATAHENLLAAIRTDVAAALVNDRMWSEPL